jgi:hypothetical protein
MRSAAINLNLRANTARAMTDFKRFADSLDNRYLVSGLKLDLITNAISQINREFQKSIGEQGMLGASSLRAAQNQAALLTATFKSFSADAAKSITQDISGALNKVAVTAGGTMEDVRKTLAATPFLSLSISADERRKISTEILNFQRDLRRAGISKDFGGVAGQFLSGKASAMDLVNTGSPMESMLGLELMKRGSGPGVIYNQDQRTKLLKAVLEDPAIKAQLQKMAVETSGYKIFLEDINTQLFNPETGLFGPLRKVVDSAGRETTSFDETNKLIQQIFGQQGLIYTFFRKIGEVFEINDPLVLLVNVIEFVTRQFKALTDFVNTPMFTGFVKFFKDTFEAIHGIFTNIYKSITSGSFSSQNINSTIHSIGESVREFIQNIGKSIRSVDITETSVTGTLADEVGKTLGILVKELLMTLVDKVPQITSTILPAINKGINALFTEIFGPGLGKMIKMALSFVPGPVGMIARASNVTDVTGGSGWMGLAGVAGAAFLPQIMGGAKGEGGLMSLVRTARGVRNLETRHETLYGMASGVDQFINSRLNPYRISQKDSDLRVARGIYGANFLKGESTRFADQIKYRPLVGVDLQSPYGPSGGLGGMNYGDLYGVGGNPGTTFDRTRRRYEYSREYMSRTGTRLSAPRGSYFDYHNLLNVADIGRMRSKSFKTPQALGLENERLNSYMSEYGATPFERNMGTLGMGPPSFIPQPGNIDYDIWGGKGLIGSELGVAGDMTPSRKKLSLRDRARGAGRWIGKNKLAIGGVLAATSLAALLSSKPAGAAEVGPNGQPLSSSGAQTQTILNSAGDVAMMFGPWGMGIGLMLKAGAALMDKSTREAVMQFGRNIMDGFTTNASNFVSWIGSQIQGLINSLGSVFTNIGKMFTGTDSKGNSNIPVVGMFQGMMSNISNWAHEHGLPGFYGGLNSAGPALALEARMSGNRPMVVNSSEFVIPRGGMATLSGIVEERVRRSMDSDSASISPTFHVTVQVNNPVMLGANKELVNSLRQPILDVIEEAWQEVSSGTIRRPSVVG